jgi:hypothetical protein
VRGSHAWPNDASDLVGTYASLQTPQFLVLPHPGEKHQVVANNQPPRQPACGLNHITLVKRIEAGYGRKTDAGNPSPGSPRFADYPQPAKVVNPKVLATLKTSGWPASAQVRTYKHLSVSCPQVVDMLVDEVHKF